MGNRSQAIIFPFILLAWLCSSTILFGQTTQIRGFVDAGVSVQKNKVSFGINEQDLFITSQLNDRFSFLGETVFKFTAGTPTNFSVSVERIVIKFNFAGNHNLLVGKHHTPVNYWNDTYHHGRVFFPTIFRPLLFDVNIIPLHTVGISFRAQNLGNLKFGYDLMVGNGIGSTEVADNNKGKSITAAVHIKPVAGLRLGISWYSDVIAKGSVTHDNMLLKEQVKQILFSGSASFFGKKFEFLAEGTLGYNKTDSLGSRQTIASYVYAGYKIKEKVVPYVRLDQTHFQAGEMFFHNNNTTYYVGGIRYNINYLTAVKIEYQYQHAAIEGYGNKVSAQLAIGF